MNIAIFRHSLGGSLGTLEKAIVDRKLSYEYIDAFYDDFDDFNLSQYDAMVFLGGSCGVYQADTYSFIDKEVKILEQCLAKDVPVLGICFGSQLMAKALGAKVFRGPQGPEMGWSPLRLTEEGKSSLVAPLGEENTNMLHFHVDTFDLPEGAVRLASSDLYENQAYSYGDKYLALQCHPETSHKILKSHEVNLGGMFSNGSFDIEATRELTKTHMTNLVKQTDVFMNGWIDNAFGKEGQTEVA